MKTSYLTCAFSINLPHNDCCRSPDIFHSKRTQLDLLLNISNKGRKAPFCRELLQSNNSELLCTSVFLQLLYCLGALLFMGVIQDSFEQIALTTFALMGAMLSEGTCSTNTYYGNWAVPNKAILARLSASLFLALRACSIFTSLNSIIKLFLLQTNIHILCLGLIF